MKSLINKYPLLAMFMVSATWLIVAAACHSANNDSSTDANVSSKDTLNTSISKEKKGSDKWMIDESASSVSFTIKNFGKEVDGSIGGLKGNINFDEANPGAASFDASVKVETINTNNDKRDKDLMGDKYFKNEQYPEIVFRSSSVTKSGNGYTAKGNLSINGVEKPIDMPFDFQQNGNEGVFSSKFTINRHDFDIGGNGPIMGDDINVHLKVQAKKQ